MTSPQLPKVFIAHEVIRNGIWKIDIGRVVRKYGEVITLLGESNEILDYAATLTKVGEQLREKNFAPDRDYFLAAGDMTAYAAMLLISAQQYGMTPRQLRHNRQLDRYDELPCRRYDGEAVLT